MYLLDITRDDTVSTRLIGALDVAEQIAREVSLENKTIVYLYRATSRGNGRYKTRSTVCAYERGRRLTFTILETLGKDKDGASKAERARAHGNDATLDGMARIVSKR